MNTNIHPIPKIPATVPAEDINKLLVYLFLQMSRRVPPRTFGAFLAGVVTNVVGTVAIDYWREAALVKPCKQPGCDCHEVEAKLFAALDEARKYHHKVVPRPNCGGSNN